jgi:alkanesulfonate monooxygenase
VNFNGSYYRIEEGKLNTPFISPRRSFPELFIAGGSDEARHLAISQGTLWMRLIDTPENLKTRIAPVLAANKEVGLRFAIIARATREESLRAAKRLVDGLDASCRDAEKGKAFYAEERLGFHPRNIRARRERVVNPWLWTGAVRTHGAPAAALVGSYDEVAQALINYASIGVTQFILSGWPMLDEMVLFGREVLPRIEGLETGLYAHGLHNVENAANAENARVETPETPRALPKP